MSLSEGQVRAYFVQRVAETGGEWRKVNWVGRSNAPDELLLYPYGQLPDGTNPPWVELKSEEAGPKFPSNAHERAQFREHERMRAAGHSVEVIWSKAQIDYLLAP